MASNRKIMVLPGDGIGPEVIAEARRVLEGLDPHAFTFREHLIGGAAIDATKLLAAEREAELGRAKAELAQHQRAHDDASGAAAAQAATVEAAGAARAEAVAAAEAAAAAAAAAAVAALRSPAVLLRERHAAADRHDGPAAVGDGLLPVPDERRGLPRLPAAEHVEGRPRDARRRVANN